MAVAIAVFAVVLAAIASERVDRTKVALAGAVVVVLAAGWEARARLTAARAR